MIALTLTLSSEIDIIAGAIVARGNVIIKMLYFDLLWNWISDPQSKNLQ